MIPTVPDGTFFDGFDKYGDADFGTPSNFEALLIMGEWNIIANNGTSFALAAPLSGDGDGYSLSLSLDFSLDSFQLTKLLGANYARVCGGVTFKWENASAATPMGLTYGDIGTAQFTIAFNNDGTFSIMRGTRLNTALITTLDAPSIGTTNCLEWDIAMLSTTASNCTIYLNGVPTTIENFNGDICANGNVQFNRFWFECSHLGTVAGTTAMRFDHFYNYFYTDPAEAGASCLLGNPVIDTDYPNNDFDFTFDDIVGRLGAATRYGTSVATPAAGSLILVKATAVGDNTLSSMTIIPNATSATAKFKGVIYTDDGTGLAPAALLDTGAEVVGCTSGVALSSDMNDIAIIDGTDYWIGFIMDTALSMQLRDTTAVGKRAANVYASGPPDPAPAMTGGQGTWFITGILDPTEGWSQLRQNPPTTGSYNQGDTVGERFLHGFDPLTVNPLEIYCVAIKPNLRRTDAGARTVSVLIESDGSESASPPVAPSSSGEWIAGYYHVDPDTGISWDTGGVNQVNGGAEIIT